MAYPPPRFVLWVGRSGHAPFIKVNNIIIAAAASGNVCSGY